MRFCRGCKQEKPESQFPTRKDGIRYHCFECTKARHQLWYEKNREKQLDAVRRNYEANKEAKLVYQKKWAEENKEKRVGYAERTARKLRDDVFRAYGGKCVCPGCGERNMLFLTIDHVHGKGNQHRKEVLGSHLKAGVHTYVWLRQQGYPKGFQILCFNCNMGRHRNGGICPHLAPARFVSSDDE